MAFFKKPAQQAELSEQDKLLRRYGGARSNILLVIVMTLINSVLLILGSDTYFLFSASIPYYMTLSGLLYTGRMPAEWYEGVEGFQPDPDSVLFFYIGIAAVIVAIYALCFFLSKKHGYGWVVFALVLFVVDTVGMFYFMGSDVVIDLIFHVWVLVSLVSGIFAILKYKKLEKNESEYVEGAPVYQNGAPVYQNGAPVYQNGAPVYQNGAPVEAAYVPAETAEATVEAQTTDITE